MDRDRVILLCMRLNLEEQKRLRRAAAAAGGGRRDGVAEWSLGVRGAAGDAKRQKEGAARNKREAAVLCLREVGWFL